MAGIARRPARLVSLRSGYKSSSNNGVSYLQVLGTGMDTGDTSPSVLLFFDNHRFIFNAGEGLQRYFVEHKIKLSRIDHVLLTRVCSETSGGLPGILLTLAGEVGLTTNIWGPPDLQHLSTALSTFLPNSSVSHTHCLGAGSDNLEESIEVLKEDVVKISGVLLRSEVPTDQGSSMTYVCELPDIKGKFDPAKALALGLRPGWKYKLLQDGTAVKSDDGQRLIYPGDVMGPSSPGPSFMLVDCPSLRYLLSLLHAKALKTLGSNDVKPLACMVHLSPRVVVNDERYQKWMSQFSGVTHIMAGPGLCKPSTIYKSSESIIAKLNFICPQVFPVSVNHESSTQAPDSSTSVVFASNQLKFHLRPLSLLGLDGSSIPSEFNFRDVQQNLVQEIPGISAVRKSIPWTDGYADTSEPPEYIRNASREDMEIVFLGTGSSKPCKHRNVSSIYVSLFKRGGFLMDCGEGTYAQLKRRYGVEQIEEVLAGLKCIWISHIHADHHAGLPRLLTARKAVLLKQGLPVSPVLVVGPVLLRRFLVAYERLESLAMDFLDCSQTVQGNLKIETQQGEPGCHVSAGFDAYGQSRLRCLKTEMDLKSFQSVPVIHTAHSFGLVVEAEAGWKLAYSGDTRPCSAFTEAAKGATVFIHEATFDDGLLEEALEKQHSLTCEAIKEGVVAGAYRTILTHFSQRYPKVPVFDESYEDNTCVAFDMMSVNLRDLPWLPRLIPAFKLLFRDEADET